MSKLKRNRNSLQKKAESGFHGYPIASVAYYGPNYQFASKVSVGIVLRDDQEPDDVEMRKWVLGEIDVRFNTKIHQEMESFIRARNVKSVAIADRIMGCPHESGLDYPEGESCPFCPFWKDKDRFTHESIYAPNG
jgi:hypothetical protein